MKLLALVLLISAFSSLTLMEVVNDFSSRKCSEFFIKNQNHIITPTVLEGEQYERICQRWKNVYRFATLYDTNNRIPVYSAYKYYGIDPPGRKKNKTVSWKNEPQLENPSDTADMKKIEGDEIDVYYNQAVNRDYLESNRINDIKYTRGHVFPRGYAADEDQADSTFTFTNVAPQTNYSNSEWERQVETPMKDEIKNRCTPNNNNPTYIVTGVVPGNKWIPIKRKDNNKVKGEGVNIPTYYWTAYCCVHNNVRISKGFLSQQNQPDGRTHEFTEMRVNILNGRLTELYKKSLLKKTFKVFGDLCLT
ncbi:endonuclease domain-containing 1 protein-like [Silurus meridionalis]|nr:endonuclease domain-containing 1 protein-like [Silurus meridionalis]